MGFDFGGLISGAVDSFAGGFGYGLGTGGAPYSRLGGVGSQMQVGGAAPGVATSQSAMKNFMKDSIDSGPTTNRDGTSSGGDVALDENLMKILKAGISGSQRKYQLAVDALQARGVALMDDLGDSPTLQAEALKVGLGSSNPMAKFARQGSLPRFSTGSPLLIGSNRNG